MILVTRKQLRALSCALALAVTLSTASPALTADVANLRPMTKANYPTDDAHKSWVPPNVFFLLDVGSPMSFSPLGTMPVTTDGKSSAEHAAMFEEATYGSGARPLSVNGTEQAVGTFGRYGRDIDPSNNIIGNPDCYYSPYGNMPYFLTFQNSAWAKWNGTGSIPSGMPSEISRYLPGQSLAGQPVPVSIANTYLVPNDSRMYKMKLVLWRMLADNGQLLSKMRTAMGTSYFETTYGGNYIADFYKYSPYDAGYYNGSAKRSLSQGPATGYVAFPHGAGPGWCDSKLPGGAIPYSNSLKAYYGVDRDLYTSTTYTPGSGRFWRLNRARMLVPFDYMYEMRDDGTLDDSKEGLKQFRRWIDGIEDVVSTTSSANQNNPELFADGKTPLSGAIYGHAALGGYSMLTRTDTDCDSSSNTSRVLIRYTGASNTSTTYGTTGSVILGTTYGIPDGNNSTVRAGQAVGSVIDFFSPPANRLTFDATAEESNNAGYFPVIGSCQRNWLVVFTAANDSDGLTGAEAVARLYEDTKTMRGRKWNGSAWVEHTFEMESGVRTLVVGFVDPDPNNPETENLRTSLKNMAKAGDPGNPDAEPFFANDVPGLIASLKAVLMRVNADQYASSSSTAAADPAGDVGALMLYSPAYIATEYGQFEGYFEKLRVKNDRTESQWEVNEELQKRSLSDRKLYTYAGGAVVGLDALDSSTFASLAGIPGSTVAAFRTWLRAFDGKTLLGDMEHAGYKVVGKAEDGSGIGARDTAIYLQTNRGFLHAIDDSDGSEKWAFVLPNALSRIRGMKYTEEGNWIEKGAYGRLDSLPMNLLDGPMIAKDVQISGGAYRTILIGNLGWGGNGFYAMDVTNPSMTTPQFLWAIDNGALTDWTTPAPPFGWGTASSMGTAYDEYKDLGLTIAPPLLMRYKLGENETDIGILPAGLCADYYNYKHTGLNTHQGQKLLIFNPADASIIDSLPSHNGGMMISPITCVTGSNGIAEMFYTADSLGNIYRCKVDDGTGMGISTPINSWSLDRIFEVKDMTAGSTHEPLMIPRALMIADSRTTNARWIFAATGNLMLPNELGEMIENPVHYVLGFNQDAVVDNHGGFADLSTSGVEQLPYERDSIDPGHGIASTDITPVDDTDPDYVGWYLPLRPAAGELLAEYVTTSPFLYGGVLYFSTFTPRATAGDTAEICPRLGDAKLYGIDPTTGSGAWNGSRALVVGDAKIVGMTAANGTLYLGVRQFRNNQNELEAAGFFKHSESLFSKEAVGGGTGNPTFAKDKPFVHYWKESFGGQ